MNEDYFYPLRDTDSLQANINISERFFYIRNWTNQYAPIHGAPEFEFLKNQSSIFLQSLVGKSYEELSHILEIPIFIEKMQGITQILQLRHSDNVKTGLNAKYRDESTSELPAYLLFHEDNSITPIEIVPNPSNANRIIKWRLHPKGIEPLYQDTEARQYFIAKTQSLPESYEYKYGYSLVPYNARNEAYMRSYNGLIPRSSGIYPPGARRYSYHNTAKILFKEGKHAFLFPISRVLPEHYAHVASLQKSLKIKNLDICKLFIQDMQVNKRVLERAQGDFKSEAEGTIHIPVEVPFHIDEILQISSAALKTIEPSALLASHMPGVLRSKNINSIESLIINIFNEIYDPNFQIDDEV